MKNKEKKIDNSTFSGWRKCSGWRRYIASWIFTDFQLARPRPFIGWELNSEGDPWFVMMEHVRSRNGRQSFGIAKDWDDDAQGLFYYRDWTSSATPFAGDGDLYWSGWWFQFHEDAKRFLNIYGGIGSWEADFKEKEAAMLHRRQNQKVNNIVVKK